MNSDVTMGYVRVAVDHLREAPEKIGVFLVERMGGESLRAYCRPRTVRSLDPSACISVG